SPTPAACQGPDLRWSQTLVDKSSGVSTAAAFDFDGDGAVELVERDECWLHIWDGRTGKVRAAVPVASRTGYEGPTIADVGGGGPARVLGGGGRGRPHGAPRAGALPGGSADGTAGDGRDEGLAGLPDPRPLLGPRPPHLEPARLPRHERERRRHHPHPGEAFV